jgi:hypothetical protein
MKHDVATQDAIDAALRPFVQREIGDDSMIA